MRHRLILATILALLLAAPATALPSGMHPSERGFAPVNGIGMFYEIFGEGPPILLVHGGLSNHKVWWPQIERLAEHHRVIVADSRGQGRSSRTAAPITYDLMASDYVKLLDVLGISKVALVGWSDGGIIGLDIAIRHPERLSALFVQAANATPDGALANVEAADLDRPLPELRHYEDVRDEIEALWANEPNFTPEELASIPVPTMVAIGDHDEAISRAHTEEIAALIPGAQLAILPNVGHSAPVEDPGTYAETVLSFLVPIEAGEGLMTAHVDLGDENSPTAQ